MSSPAEEEGVPPEGVGAAAISMPPGVAAALRAMNERVAATEQRLAATEAKVQELELEVLRDDFLIQINIESFFLIREAVEKVSLMLV